MKKITILLAFIVFINLEDLQAQSFDLGVLDNAMSMINSGDNKKVAGILSDATLSLKDEAKKSNGDFATKLLGQATALGGLIPSIRNGNADMNLIQKVISTIKTLVAAQRLKNLLGGSLLGKGSQVGSNVNILQTGLGALGSGASVSKLSKMLDVVRSKSDNLDKTGMAANMAQKVIGKKLGSSLNLLNGLL